ncbi:MAG TPA: C-factor [Alphaproteobacteria bacterium]|nr:C-factor [Alphaproteobacteria bacterium]
MTSLPANYRAVVFGASGGIGSAFVDHLSSDPRCGVVYAGARITLAPVPKVQPFAFDLRDETSIAMAAQMMSEGGPLDLVIVATGVLHREGLKPEKTYRSLDADTMAAAFAVNAIGPALIAKHMLPLLARDRKAIFAAISARVGSISDNRLGGWHAYRASKAALNMLIRNFAIEQATRNKHALCVALHPGTVDTALSKPFQAGVAADKLFTPDHSAAAMLYVLDAATAERTGTLIAWEGQTIAF